MNLALKMAIVASGTPQHAIARKTGISETILSRIVQGRREPTQEQRRSLARALGRREEDLFPSSRGKTP